MAHHSLRRAQAADTEAVLHIQKEAMLPHVVAQYGAWNELERQKRFRAEDILEHDMIEVDGRVAGCVWVRRSPAHHEVVRLYLLAAFQNQGIGSAVLRSIMREGEEPVERHDLSSLRLLGTVGEPINPEAWSWYHRVVGKSRLPIVDTWWQTETGACLMTPLPGAHDLKPGAASFPMFSIEPALVDNDGNRLPDEGPQEGNLVILGSWPGQMRTVYGDHKRFAETYFSTYRGLYFTGDGAKRDEDGYWWITGRVDDVLNVSGHRLGTAEIESALVSHRDVAEAAVVGYPHDIKGQGVYCYVTLNAGVEVDDDTTKALKQHVRKEIGPVASPDLIQFAPGLPKTRSGKIMRRILRKIAENQFDSLGDISTLAEPAVVDELINGRLNRD